MGKVFYTENDIEDLVKRGVMSLEVDENTVLTDLAYEKARKLGMQLRSQQPDNPPGAPVRPYIAQGAGGPASAPSAVSSAASAAPQSTPAAPPAAGKELHERIRSAVIARLGSQVDAGLLDVIIQRVLSQTGVK